MNSRRLRWFASMFTALLLMTGSFQGGIAQDDSTPGDTPSGSDVQFAVYPEGGVEGQFFEATIEPGASQDLTLGLLNAGADPLALKVYPANAYSMTNGGMGVHFQDQERTGQTTWLTFPEGVVEIPAGEETLIPFTVTAPDGTAPGQYVTAIGVETAEAFAVGGGSTLSQVLRKVIAVAIVVPGPLEPSFAIGTPELTVADGQSVLRLPIENTGNIRVQPTGTVVLKDATGGELATGEAAMGSVYMGNTAPFEMWLPVALPDGEYTVTATLTDPDTGAAASIENAPVAIVHPEPTPAPEAPAVSTPMPEPEAQPVTIASASITANAEPIQFANVAIGFENAGNHISQARVALTVFHNGEQVEEMVLDDNLPLPPGATSVEDRYIPPTGWESGTWTFALTVHAVNATTGAETLLISEPVLATIEVP